MPITHLVILILVFFVTSVVSVVTGSTSLITVPAMLQFHIDPKIALATNMFALTFLSAGASFPLGKSKVRQMTVLGATSSPLHKVRSAIYLPTSA